MSTNFHAKTEQRKVKKERNFKIHFGLNRIEPRWFNLLRIGLVSLVLMGLIPVSCYSLFSVRLVNERTRLGSLDAGIYKRVSRSNLLFHSLLPPRSTRWQSFTSQQLSATKLQQQSHVISFLVIIASSLKSSPIAVTVYASKSGYPI